MPSTLIVPGVLPGIVQPLDGTYGLQAIAHGATNRFYQINGQTGGALKGRDAFVEKRPPGFAEFRRPSW